MKTKLVCKACRAQGFTAWSVEAYTCHTCSCKFGPNKFATFALQNVGIVKYSISWGYKSIGFSTETSCARTAQSEDTHQESTTSTNAKTRCGAGWWLLVVVLLGRKKVDGVCSCCVDAHEQRNAKTDGHWATCTDLPFSPLEDHKM